jgi:hypothetical protein
VIIEITEKELSKTSKYKDSSCQPLALDDDRAIVEYMAVDGRVVGWRTSGSDRFRWVSG